MFFKRTSMYEWSGASGAETEAKLGTPTLAGNSNFQAKTYDDLVAAGATLSEERWFAMKYTHGDTHTKVKDARITKLHGTFQTDHTLLAGGTPAYITPKAVGVAGVATVEIPTNIMESFHDTTDELTLATFDATDEEYQFLVMQHDFATTPAAWDPEKQPGDSGYAIVEVAYALTDKDGGIAPAGDDNFSRYEQAQVDIYILDGNGDMQLFGCIENNVTHSFNLEWDDVLKGALNGRKSKFFTGRNTEFSGNLLTINPHNVLKFMHGDNLGSNGLSTQIQLNSNYKVVEQTAVIFDTFSSAGRRYTVHSPKAFLKINGDYTVGDGVSTMPFMIDMGETVNLHFSDDLWDVHRFRVGITLT